MSPESTYESAAAELQAAISEALTRYATAAQPLCLALSGGRDSVVLLHALRTCATGHPLRAVHVDHGLHADSAAWSQACAELCANFGVPLQTCKVMVARDSGLGLEAAARDARYAALAAQLAPDELLVTAHHRNDQVETLLLQLLRGAGMHGIAAMPVYGQRTGIALLRPLLSVAAETIRDYAAAYDLSWIEDPSNADPGMDRNYLRREIIPRLQQRWQAAGTAIARTARLAGEAAEVLDELADADLDILQSGNCIDLAGLQRLSAARQRNALRRALRQLGMPVPAEKQLALALATMCTARDDAQPLVAWPGVRLYRYQHTLWLFAEGVDPSAWSTAPQSYRWNLQTVLDMGSVRGRLVAEPCQGAGIALLSGDEEFVVRFRQGGEALRPAANAATRDLKKLLQEKHVVPWMRQHIPLLYRGEQLVAVGDLWISADCAAAPGERGVSIGWSGHAALFQTLN